MLITISVLLVFLYTGYSLVKVNEHKQRLPGMTGMIISMTVGMTASLTAGTLLGVIFKNELAVSTIAAILFSLIVGFFIGKPISLLAMAEGMMAGIMGGMMGAMLGEMLPADQSKMMLIFMDCLFILIMSFVIAFMKGEMKKGMPVPSTSLQPHSLFLTMIVSVIIIFTSAYMDENQADAQIHGHHHQ